MAHFINSNSIIHKGLLPICRECIAADIEQAPKEEQWNLTDKYCQWADVPFIPETWSKMYEANGAEAFGVYVAMFRDKPYNTLNWKQYNDVYLRIKDENRVEDALPLVKEEKERKMRQKWGPNYTTEELEYLENLHSGLLKTQNVVGALQEDQAIKLCKLSLMIEVKIRAGEDITREIKAYDDLSKLANFTSKVIRDGNEFSSVGEIYAFLEKSDWINRYYDDAVRDEVDYSIKDMKLWTQYLYTNETGIAEEIDRRISQLELAAKLTGDNFDKDEFKDYAKKQEKVNLEEEEFKLEV